MNLLFLRSLIMRNINKRKSSQKKKIITDKIKLFDINNNNNKQG